MLDHRECSAPATNIKDDRPMTSEANIFVLDRDPDASATMRRCLEAAGFSVHTLASSDELRQLLRRVTFEVGILDLNLRAEDGLALLSELHRESAPPIIILTGKGEAIDRVLGLEMGADDYVAKPFEPRELLARVRSVLRRMRKLGGPHSDAARADALRCAGFTLDPHARALLAPDGAQVSLTTSQYEILYALAAHPNRALSRSQIMTLARSKDAAGYDRTVDVHVGHLRRKIEADPQAPRIIKTVHGVGYLFAAMVEHRPLRRLSLAGY
jgi:two-component system OmpR family response regulator